MSTTVAAQDTRTTWELDPAHTLVEFAVKHMMFTTVKGRFTGVSGTIGLGPEGSDPVVAVEIDAATVDTRVADRDAHLRSADFLDVATYPKLTFRSERIERVGSDYRVTGPLTIRGVTREVTLDAELTGQGRDPWGQERIGVAARATLNRADFGLTWNAVLEAGGVLVGDEVRITIEAEAVRKD